MTSISDEELVGYLDGQVDPKRWSEIDTALMQDEVLAERLAALEIDNDALISAFDAVAAAAPVDRLRARLGKRPSLPSRPQFLQRWGALAAMLLVGVAFGYAMGASDLVRGSKDWHVAVADYQALYTNATLAPIADDPARQQGEVADVAAKLGLKVPFDALQIPGLAFKRAQLLAFNGRPIAQFAYLDESGDPLAFCIMPTGENDSAITPSTFQGLRAASWSRNGYGFIVIGALRSESVREAAQQLSKRI